MNSPKHCDGLPLSHLSAKRHSAIAGDTNTETRQHDWILHHGASWYMDQYLSNIPEMWETLSWFTQSRDYWSEPEILVLSSVSWNNVAHCWCSSREIMVVFTMRCMSIFNKSWIMAGNTILNTVKIVVHSLYCLFEFVCQSDSFVFRKLCCVFSWYLKFAELHIYYKHPE